MQVAVFGRNFPSYARENIATMFSKFSMLNVDVWVYEPLYEFLQKETGLRPKVAGLFNRSYTICRAIWIFFFPWEGTEPSWRR